MKHVDRHRPGLPAATGGGQYRVQPTTRSRRGASAIEYCLLLSMITMTLIVGVQQLGSATSGVFGGALSKSLGGNVPASSGDRPAPPPPPPPPPPPSNPKKPSKPKAPSNPKPPSKPKGPARPTR